MYLYMYHISRCGMQIFLWFLYYWYSPPTIWLPEGKLTPQSNNKENYPGAKQQSSQEKEIEV